MTKPNKRVRNPKKYLSLVKENELFYIGFEIREESKELLQNLGFSEKMSPGETVLPSIVGPVSEFNAEGTEVIRKDLPKETVYYPREWTVTDWGGYEHTGVNYMPYERYPRELIPPLGFELQIIEKDGAKIVVSKQFINNQTEYGDITHAMNLFLEIFRDMQILKEDMSKCLKTSVIRLNWEILPPGINPWAKVSDQVKRLTESSSSGEKTMIAERFKHIEKYNPDQVAIGLGGFAGYLIFGFTGKNIYLLESLRYGNATYVFGTNWEKLSQMTKAEILHNNHQKERIIHKDGWPNEVNKILQIKVNKY